MGEPILHGFHEPSLKANLERCWWDELHLYCCSWSQGCNWYSFSLFHYPFCITFTFSYQLSWLSSYRLNSSVLKTQIYLRHHWLLVNFTPFRLGCYKCQSQLRWGKYQEVPKWSLWFYVYPSLTHCVKESHLFLLIRVGYPSHDAAVWIQGVQMALVATILYKSMETLMCNLERVWFLWGSGALTFRA